MMPVDTPLTKLVLFIKTMKISNKERKQLSKLLNDVFAGLVRK